MLQNNDIEMYSTHKDLKSVIAEMFVRTFKKKKLPICDFNIKEYVY